jgi:NAD(P)-dependent dehydrogenase (short-subunit alcohol dehydrogenase family)
MDSRSVAHHHRIDIIIANAGVIHRAGSLIGRRNWTSEAWDEVLAANLKACFFLAQQAAAPMRSHKAWANYFYNVDRGSWEF